MASALRHSALRNGEWGERWGSNPRPPEPQPGALPTELRSPYNLYIKDSDSIRFFRPKATGF